ncbi:hypothetical protein FIBSPDRAFT_727366 [Athelia psychrophila]|uniref:Uncharacterized protein n=1 Tax=Athelia psychrophila TaxID=1759441 RepID=A0A166SJ91_9AGAM|nr:hypothetical protein FIBSPDRAFT_727366 [Fibularhizoctonia sp. CBS 109695]
MTEYLPGADEGLHLSDSEYPEATGDLPNNDGPPHPSSHLPPEHIPTAAAERQRQIDDIRTKFHAHSQRPTTFTHFEDYGLPDQEGNAPFDPASLPWSPFRTRIDFEIADLVHDLAMSKAQTDTFLSLLPKKWDECITQHAPFQLSKITVVYRKQPRIYDVHHRPLWDWVLGLLNHPRLIKEFTWDAQRISKWDGSRWERLWHEPWTAGYWWELQSKLPPGASPIALILYADKTRLSSFGTAKAYPVVARCANLPVHIRNSNGIGGGQVVGWLPIVEEESSESGKKNFVLHKNIVWHEAFRKILEQLVDLAKHGYNHTCADDILRWLFPILIILSTDYEEQCIMALIRGIKCNFPCPKCEVPRIELLDYTKKYTIRTAKNTSEYLKQASKLKGDAKEEKLKDHGLRNVKNEISKLTNWDALRALAHDRLHIFHGGVFPHHLWVQLKRHLKALGRDALDKVDKQIALLPRWSGLNHFNGVTHMLFTDGSKYEDISKVILFATHNVITEAACPLGYLLLKCLRSYLVVDMYVALEVHTQTTIQAGRAAVLAFGVDLTAYTNAIADTDFDDKNWGAIIKLHLWVHIFDDIKDKGVSRNSNTKPNEKLHGPLKKHYLRRTNFKDVAPQQILRAEHISCVTRIMREDLCHYDENTSKGPDPPEDIEEDSKADVTHVHLGAAQPTMSISMLRIFHQDDNALCKITANNIINFFREHLPREDLPEPLNKIDILRSEITEFQYLKVTYTSTVDWRCSHDNLRRNPSFHGRERHDCVILHETETTITFAKLLFIFKCSINNGKGPYSLALVQKYNMYIPRRERLASDKELGMIRVRAQPRKDSTFIFVDSIIRGAMLVSTFDELVSDECFVVDSVDTDMFLRLQNRTPLHAF